MQQGLEQYFRQVIDGTRRGPAPWMIRTGLSMVEPFYAAVASVRRDRRRGKARVGRPVSVGNITTGGTGKTPVVRWLTQKLIDAGHSPAILMRGYKPIQGFGSDEQRLLASQLPQAIVQANPSRVAGARTVLSQNSQVDVFVLDDGFQHLRIWRDFDLVLIDATNPFGFGRVLPRGLLREPMSSLAWADALLITRMELASASQIEQIHSTLRRYNPAAPIYHCRHVHLSIASADGKTMPISNLSGRKVATVCGIGNPEGFERQIDAEGAIRTASLRFADHHYYTARDLTILRDRSMETGAEMLVTTEKDWVKLSGMISSNSDLPPIWRTRLEIQFLDDDEQKLMGLINSAINQPRSTRAS